MALAVVDGAAMGDGHGDNDKLLILNSAQDAIVADAVASKARKIISQRFAVRGSSEGATRVSR